MITEREARKTGELVGIGLGVGIAIGLAIGLVSAYYAWTTTRAEPGAARSTAEPSKDAPVGESKAAESAPPGPSDRDLGLASLKNLNTALYDLGYEPSQARINEVRANLKCLRDWIGAAPDRQPYMLWVEYYEKDLDKAQGELSSGAREREAAEFKAWEKENAERQARDEALAKTLPRPPREAMTCASGGEAKAKAKGRARAFGGGRRSAARPASTVAELPACGDRNQGAAALVTDINPDCRTGGGANGPNFLAECRCKPEGWVVESLMWSSSVTIDSLAPGETATVGFNIH